MRQAPCGTGEALASTSDYAKPAQLNGPLPVRQPAQQLELFALDGDEFTPLRFLQLVDFLVQQHDFQLGLEVDFVVVLSANAVLVCLAVLRHENDGRLYGRQHGQKQVQQNIGIRVERGAARPKQKGVEAHPDQHGCAKQRHKGPGAAKGGDGIGCALAEGGWCLI